MIYSRVMETIGAKKNVIDYFITIKIYYKLLLSHDSIKSYEND